MFSPDFELTWNFGKDTETILKMMYLVENCDMVRYAVLGHFVNFMDENEGKIKKYLSKKEKG